MELGLFSFAAMTPDPATGVPMGAGERLRDLVEEIELADQVGLDIFAVGEHHRPDYAVSAPAVVLAAAAARTRNIRLSSAVTVLSTDDPIRVYQQFATLDLLSSGRAEIMAGRGSFNESFALFPQPGNSHDTVFDEKLAQLLEARATEQLAHHRLKFPSAPGIGIYPRIQAGSMPVWLGIGGTPQSVIRAATLGLPMNLAIIGGDPARYRPFVELYREVWAKAGHAPELAALAISSNGFIADTPAEAANLFFPSYELQMNRLGNERGWPRVTRRSFDAERTLAGALAIGDPQQLIDRILHQHGLFGHQRFLLQLSVGTVPHAAVMRAIELYGTKVAPAVRTTLKRN